jgi:hypothetical protein
MSTRIVFISISLFSALLSSYSSAIAADIRPEVAQPLDQARVLVNGGADKAAIVVKLNQAASVPNLNSDERHQIVIAREYALARLKHRLSVPGVESTTQTRDTLPQSSINATFPYR